MQRIHRLISLCASALLVIASVAPAHADETTWQADLEHSKLLVKVYKAGFFSSLAHDHVFAVTKWQATIQLDPASPEKGSVVLVADARSLRLVDSKADKDDQRSIEKTARGDEVLDAEKFPEIRFESSRVVVAEPGEKTLKLEVTGLLKLHGKSREVTIPVTLTLGDKQLEIAGSVRIRQSRHGMEPYSAFLGAVSVKDDIDIELDLTAQPKE